MQNKPITCLVCAGEPLLLHRTPDGLKTYRCAQCHGMWVRGTEYLDWLASKSTSTRAGGGGAAEGEAAGSSMDHAPQDSKAGKLCLDCGRLMRWVRVGHGVGFHLDRCMTCGGFWFDAAEWDRLGDHGLADKAHLIFTDAWQSAVRRVGHAKAEQSRRESRLGAETAKRVEEIRAWIAEHPRGEEILARLVEDAPGD